MAKDYASKPLKKRDKDLEMWYDAARRTREYPNADSIKSETLRKTRIALNDKEYNANSGEIGVLLGLADDALGSALRASYGRRPHEAVELYNAAIRISEKAGKKDLAESIHRSAEKRLKGLARRLEKPRSKWEKSPNIHTQQNIQNLESSIRELYDPNKKKYEIIPVLFLGLSIMFTCIILLKSMTGAVIGGSNYVSIIGSLAFIFEILTLFFIFKIK